MSVTAPAGFRAAGVTAGLKTVGPDLAVVVNDGPRADAAGLFTANRIRAAPVLWSAEALRSGRLRAVVLNSGGANACTGPAGFRDTHLTAETAAGLLGVSAGEVAVCSTGLIGERLPMDRVCVGVADAVAALSTAGGPAAADAIRTTDTVSKQVVVAGAGFTVGGMAKGAGMLAPELATMLVVLTTDAAAEPADLHQALRTAATATFERLDTDGCMSTNDTVLLLASGAAGPPTVPELRAAVRSACESLADQLIADAEGASRELRVQTVGAASEPDALQVCRAVARSNLVKCAVHGGDPNWGRILAAVGTTGAAFAPDGVDVSINGVCVCRGGAAAAQRQQVDMSDRVVDVCIDLHRGPAAACIRSTDLSARYVHDNAAYST